MFRSISQLYRYEAPGMKIMAIIMALVDDDDEEEEEEEEEDFMG